MKSRVLEWVKSQCDGSRHVVEFGAGKLDYIVRIRCRQRTAIEICGEYVKLQKSTDALTVIVADMRDYRNLGLRKFDCALFVDSIEHLTKDDALKLLRQLQEDGVRIASFVPEGEYPQTEDVWGCNNPHQTHLSTWNHKEFADLGFETEQWPGFHEDHETGDAFVVSWSPA